MGWLFPYGATRRSLIAELIEPATWTNAANVVVDRQTIAHCTRGNVLWCVVQISLDGREEQCFIVCNLLKRDNTSGDWGYKDMDEGCGPFYYTVPPKYLKLAYSGINEEWRASVDAYQQRRRTGSTKNQAHNEVKVDSFARIVHQADAANDLKEVTK